MKRIYLSIVAITLILLGSVILLAPGRYLPGLTGAIRGFGGVYLGFAAWLLIAIRRKSPMDAAVWSAVAVMIGVLAGRGADMIAVGAPDVRTWASIGVELLFAAWGAWIIRRAGRAD